jgi:phosphoglycolate phosphatase
LLKWPRAAINLRLVARNCRVSLIGDHPNDIEAAKRNGFQAVAVATGLTSAEELQRWEPDILVRDLTELDPGELI